MPLAHCYAVTVPSPGEWVVELTERRDLQGGKPAIAVSEFEAEIAAAGLNLAVETAFTADGPVSIAQCDGRLITNTGAAGTVVLALPQATVGLHLFINNIANQLLRADPSGVEVIGTGGGGKYLQVSTVGGYAELLCVYTGIWAVRSSHGTIDFEA